MTSKALLLLEQQQDRATGSVMTPTGDHRFPKVRCAATSCSFRSVALSDQALVAGLSETDEVGIMRSTSGSFATKSSSSRQGMPTESIITRV